MSGIDPHIENLGPWVSLGSRHSVPTPQLHELFAPTYEKVAAAAADAGVRLLGPAYAEYFGIPGEMVDVEIGFGVDRVVDIPGLVAAEHPAVRAVVGTHVGPYDKLEESYAELLPWLEMEEVELGDSMLEFYDSPPDTDPEVAVTRLVFPLA